MKIAIAHFSVFSPNLSGMYATVKDMIRAERMQGIDAQFIDYNIDSEGHTFSRVGLIDEDIITQSPEWAYKEADILIRHSLIVEPIIQVGKPIIMAMHGRPEYSYMLEHYGLSPVMSIMCNHETDNTYVAYISFWQEHESFWSLMMPERKVHYLPSVVDLKRFNPEGIKYFSNSWNGKPNILVTDLWREDITPFNVILAAAEFKKRYCKDAKLHIFGLPSPKRGFVSRYGQKLKDAGITGETNTLVPFMENVYRAADILVTPHKIATRVIREAMASGLSIVAGSGCPYTTYVADARDTSAFAHQINRCWTTLQLDTKKKMRKVIRERAEKEFGYEALGKAMLKLGNEILSTPRDIQRPIEWTDWSLDPSDWIVLRDVIIERKITDVVEFGAGVSTQLMDKEGIAVDSFETMPEHLEKIKRLVTKSTITLWNGMFPPVLEHKYKLALIDGPSGGENREPSYKAVVESKVSLVACHDSQRKEDRVWIDKYFSKWKKVAENTESIAGLLILERPLNG